MTVSSSLNRKAYTGDGVTTSFSTSPVVFFDSSDLGVYVVTTATGASTTLTENTHYTVSGGAGSTGAVSLAGGSSPYGAPSASQTLVIVRTLDLVQEFNPQNNDGSDADNIETAFDKLTMMAQQNAASLARAFKLADSDVSGASLTVPTPSASKLIGWDSAGTGLANYASASIADTIVPTAFMETLLDDTSAATARATLDAQQDVFTTRGDLVRAGASGVAERVALGAAGTVLTSDGTDAVWGAASTPVNGRLTLTTALPVTISDVSAASTVYFTPYNGNRVEYYNGTVWVPTALTEVSQATTDSTKSPAAVANNSVYDMFFWNDSGTNRCTRGPAWTSATARGTGAATTELEVFEGRLVNKYDITNGPLARRGLYVGSIASNGTATIDDTAARRMVWNNYNEVLRPCAQTPETTNSWTYTTATFRQANGASGNQFTVLRGIDRHALTATAIAAGSNSGANGFTIGIGLNSSTVNSAMNAYAAGTVSFHLTATYNGLPGLGVIDARWLEHSDAAGTTTWYGDRGVTAPASGITGATMQ